MIRIVRVQRLTVCIEIERYTEGGYCDLVIGLLS